MRWSEASESRSGREVHEIANTYEYADDCHARKHNDCRASGVENAYWGCLCQGRGEKGASEGKRCGRGDTAPPHPSTRPSFRRVLLSRASRKCAALPMVGSMT